MTQTAAILIDAYRELNARRLFWITLIISGIVVAALAAVGITEQGIRILVWDFETPGFNTSVMAPDVFYKSIFTNLGIGIWLTWAAAILALISTASIFPDFITSGSIDLALSKPIGRWRLFLTKYASGLLFVALQVSVFSMAAFLVIGVRGGSWEWGIFLAIPIVVVFFSYLFCVCVLIGLLTRSTIAALLLTIVFWFGVFAVHSTETLLLLFHETKQQQVERIERRVAQQEESLAMLRTNDAPQDAVARVEEQVNANREDLARERRTFGRLTTAHRASMAVKTVLPKTSETIDLLERSLIDLSDVPGMGEEWGDQTWDPDRPNFEGSQRDVVEKLRQRSVAWIVGTSLIFEAFILLFAGFVFSRRDF